MSIYVLSRTRGQVREVPIRVEGDSSGVNRDSNRTTEERIIPTNAEHRDFGMFSRLLIELLL